MFVCVSPCAESVRSAASAGCASFRSVDLHSVCRHVSRGVLEVFSEMPMLLVVSVCECGRIFNAFRSGGGVLQWRHGHSFFSQRSETSGTGASHGGVRRARRGSRRIVHSVAGAGRSTREQNVVVCATGASTDGAGGPGAGSPQSGDESFLRATSVMRTDGGENVGCGQSRSDSSGEDSATKATSATSKQERSRRAGRWWRKSVDRRSAVGC